MTDESDDRRARLVEAASAGAELARESFRTALAVETKAGPLDTVTEVDRAVQRRVIERIRDAYPDDPVVGEEDVGTDGPGGDGGTADEVPDAGRAWVVDPIDGTNNYVAGTRNWVTSVALVRDAEPVAAANVAPALGERYVAVKEPRRGDEPISVSSTAAAEATVNPVFGLSRPHREGLKRVTAGVADRFGDLRRVGSGQLALSMVAAGELDAAVSTVRLPPWDTIAGVHLVREAGGTVTDLDGRRWEPDADGLIASNGDAHAELLDAFGRE